MDTTSSARPEREMVELFLEAGASASISGVITSTHYGACALSCSTIKPYMRIRGIGNGLFLRQEAVDMISIRGNESVDDVLARFGWASRELAAEWLSDGKSMVILVSRLNLKPRVVRPRPAMGSITLDKVTSLYWQSVAFMLRRV